MRRRVPAILLLGAAAAAGTVVVRRVLRERAELAARRQAWATGQAPAQLSPAPVDELAVLRQASSPPVPAHLAGPPSAPDPSGGIAVPPAAPVDPAFVPPSAPASPIDTVAVVNEPPGPAPAVEQAPLSFEGAPVPTEGAPLSPEAAPLSAEAVPVEEPPVVDHLDQVRQRLASIRVDGPGGRPETGRDPSAGRPRRSRGARLPRWIEPAEDGTCGSTHPVKVKLRSGLFHLPGMLAYDRTRADRCYRASTDAEADGFERAKR